MQKWMLISVVFLIVLCLYASMTERAYGSTMVTIRVKYCGGGNASLPDNYWDSDLTPSGLNFYINDSLIAKTLADGGTTLLLSLPTDNTYVLTYNYIEYPYWIYTFNLTYTCSFHLNSMGKLDSITYEYGSYNTKYNPETDTLYIGLPLLGTQPQYQIAWNNVAILTVVGIAVSGLVIWKVRKH